MAGSRRCGKGWGRFAATALLTLALALLTGSATAGGLKGADLEQARRLYSQLKAAAEEQRARQCLELAGTLLDYYPTYERNDEVLVLAVDAAATLQDGRHALALTDELLADHPHSPLIDGALGRAAAIAVAGGDSLRAAHYLLLHHDRDPVAGQRDDGAPRSAALFERLSAGQLADLVLFHPDSEMLPWLQCQRVRRLLDADRAADARQVVARLETDAPDDRWTVEALNLIGLAAPAQAAVRDEPEGPVRTRKIGVFCPTSGRYAELGAAFLAAARLAMAHANAELDRNYTLAVEDTGGDPVAGALAARRLCIDQGAVALFGDLLSDPTTAAAVVAEQYGAPLVSPTATNDRIWEVGDNVFQTNLAGLYEPRLLARLSATLLLKKSFAVLYPEEPEGRRHADAFVAEVERLGGHVVARESFPADAVDVQAAITAVRDQSPEVVFVPATPQQILLLGPQLERHRLGALVLGLSTWGSPEVAAQAGLALEGAVFAGDHPLFPAHWAESFHAEWTPGAYPPEAEPLALQAYQAMRLLLDTLAASGARTRSDLVGALRRRLSQDDVDISGPQAYGQAVRIMRSQHAEPFPAALFAGSQPGGSAAATPDRP